ncbi:DoxX family protein [Hymenobacter sp. GOD-10R]|uniref:DoxX family protein n=1 Tax=Hymenobacter sp. GOD-10R TaxID=3093922 RepID=UPI002D79B6EF|nr:hypothetical protein [Hymenobacter sp. GOD-10R]WRQ30085.1 hypothetical protein SD425_07405 [Hymenobacter sp. GOD-10R]
MKPLLVLLITFGLLVLATYFVQGHADALLAGNVAMAIMLFFTGAGHFALTQGMVAMMPIWLPAKKALVYFTGIIELAAAVGLLVPALRILIAWPLIAFFVLILPANIRAALHHIDYQKGTIDGPGPRYLWFRIPLQLFFIAWVWYFSWALPLWVSILHPFTHPQP